MNKNQTNQRPSRRSVAIVAGCLALLSAAIGCGEKDPELSDSRNYLVEARDAMNAGDKPKAMELLKSSIEARPNTWAYFELARMQVEAGEDDAALANVNAGLELDPDNGDFKWLKGEIEKPQGKRFQGRFKNPPSASK